MLEKPSGSGLAVVLVVCLVAAYFAARHLVLDGGGPPARDAPVYTAREAGEHVGEYGRVCGTVVDAAQVPRIDGAPTFLNFGRPYPDPVFTVVVWRDVRAAFDVPPESAFRNRRICVTGLIEEHEGRPQIVLDRPAQITEPPDTLPAPRSRP